MDLATTLLVASVPLAERRDFDVAQMHTAERVQWSEASDTAAEGVEAKVQESAVVVVKVAAVETRMGLVEKLAVVAQPRVTQHSGRRLTDQVLLTLAVLPL